MPELPEVETIMQGLIPVLEGRRIDEVSINRPDLRKPFPPELKKNLRHQTVIKLRRRAKYILIDVSNGMTLLIHLGMSGRIFIEYPPLQEKMRKHEHFSVMTNDGCKISLIDPRRFGLVSIFETRKENDFPLLARLGIEPLSPAGISEDFFLDLFKDRRTSIKSILLDQKIIAGLGNIYVCEALYQSAIHPERTAKSLTRHEVRTLCRVIPEILHQALEAGGSTLRDYVKTDGQKGGFQELHQVYGREGKGCPTCPGSPECKGVERISQSGRSSFYCPLKQRLT